MAISNTKVSRLARPSQRVELRHFWLSGRPPHPTRELFVFIHPGSFDLTMVSYLSDGKFIVASNASLNLSNR